MLPPVICLSVFLSHMFKATELGDVVSLISWLDAHLLLCFIVAHIHGPQSMRAMWVHTVYVCHNAPKGTD